MTGFVVAILVCAGANCNMVTPEPNVTYPTAEQCSAAVTAKSAALQALAAKHSSGGTPGQIVCIRAEQAIVDVEEAHDVLETAIVHKEPDAASPYVGVVEKGKRTLVTGVVSGTSWVRVLLPDGQAGFVFADRLSKVVGNAEATAGGGTTPTGSTPPAAGGSAGQPEAAASAVPPSAQEKPTERPGTASADQPKPPAAQQPTARAPNTRQVPEPRVAAGAHGEFRDCDTCPVMIPVPAGSFLMGSAEDYTERPPHMVAVHQFAIGVFEVTVAEWQACVAAQMCSYKPPTGDSSPERRPMSNLSWADAEEYISWLQRTTGKPYRLPSEAEWEYAAAAGTTSRYAWGEQPETGKANCKGCESSHDDKRPVDVGTFPPNAWGLHDMEGGVAEWVEDCWHGSYQGAPANSEAWRVPNCTRHVLRGGSWMNPPGDVTVRVRNFYDTTVRYGANGMRVALTLR